MSREFPRSRRIEEQIQRVLSDVVRSEARDPRLTGVIITHVKVSRDLAVAWVNYSMLDEGRNLEEVVAAFDKAGGFLRGRLASELTIRRVPELRFKYDEAGPRGAALEKLIDDAVAKDRTADDAVDGTEISDDKF